MQSKFFRADFSSVPSDVKVSEKVKAQWHGQIVSYEGGDYWSLEGRNMEGVGLWGDCKPCMKELSDEEMVIAQLLEDTFWKRDFYTEDMEILRSFRS